MILLGAVLQAWEPVASLPESLEDLVPAGGAFLGAGGRGLVLFSSKGVLWRYRRPGALSCAWGGGFAWGLWPDRIIKFSVSGKPLDSIRLEGIHPGRIRFSGGRLVLEGFEPATGASFHEYDINLRELRSWGTAPDRAAANLAPGAAHYVALACKGELTFAVNPFKLVGKLFGRGRELAHLGLSGTPATFTPTGKLVLREAWEAAFSGDTLLLSRYNPLTDELRVWLLSVPGLKVIKTFENVPGSTPAQRVLGLRGDKLLLWGSEGVYLAR